MAYRILGVCSIIASLMLMKSITRKTAESGGAAAPASTAEALLVAAIWGVNGGLALHLWNPMHPWNPPVSLPDRLIYWITSLFMCLAVIRTMGIRPAGKVVLAALCGVVLTVVVGAALSATLGAK